MWNSLIRICLVFSIALSTSIGFSESLSDETATENEHIKESRLQLQDAGSDISLSDSEHKECSKTERHCVHSCSGIHHLICEKLYTYKTQALDGYLATLFVSQIYKSPYLDANFKPPMHLLI